MASGPGPPQRVCHSRGLACAPRCEARSGLCCIEQALDVRRCLAKAEKHYPHDLALSLWRDCPYSRLEQRPGSSERDETAVASWTVQPRVRHGSISPSLDSPYHGHNPDAARGSHATDEATFHLPDYGTW